MSKGLKALEVIKNAPTIYVGCASDIYTRYSFECKEIEKELKALEIIKQCLVSEFKLFEKDGEYLILFYFDEIHELTFKLKNKEEYDLLKEVLE